MGFYLLHPSSLHRDVTRRDDSPHLRHFTQSEHAHTHTHTYTFMYVHRWRVYTHTHAHTSEFNKAQSRKRRFTAAVICMSSRVCVCFPSTVCVQTSITVSVARLHWSKVASWHDLDLCVCCGDVCINQCVLTNTDSINWWLHFQLQKTSI